MQQALHPKNIISMSTLSSLSSHILQFCCYLVIYYVPNCAFNHIKLWHYQTLEIWAIHLLSYDNYKKKAGKTKKSVTLWKNRILKENVVSNIFCSKNLWSVLLDNLKRGLKHQNLMSHAPLRRLCHT